MHGRPVTSLPLPNVLRGFIGWLRCRFGSPASTATTEPTSEPIEPVIVDRIGEPIRDTTWQPTTPPITDWEREAKVLRAVYGVCVMERDAAQHGNRSPNVEALAYRLLQALGVESTAALHSKLEEIVRKRRVSGA